MPAITGPATAEGEHAPYLRAHARTRATVFEHLWFSWFLIWALIVTVPCSLWQIVSHQLSPTARNFKRSITAWGKGVLYGAGIRVRLMERQPLDPTQPYVFVANHENLLDILAIAGTLPYPFGFVAKVELAGVPFLGMALRHSASVFVDRSDPRRAIESVREAGERIRAGNSVLIFAEGGRTYGPELHEFKKGAFLLALEAGVPIVPVAVVDAYRLMDERLRAARPGTVHLVVGEPIHTAGMPRRSLQIVMDAVRHQLEEALAPELDRLPR